MKKKKIFLPVSCLCSLYKKSELLEVKKSFNSLLNQKYIPNQIVIVLDGEINKNVFNYIRNLKTKYSDLIKIINLKFNKGLGISLNIGLNECDNELIARFDTDDINLKKRILIQYKFLIDNPKVDIYGSSVVEFFIKGTKIFSRKKIMPISNKEINKCFKYRNPINHPTVMFRKKVIKDSGSYIPMQYFEDYHLWLRCKKNKRHFANSFKPLVAMHRKNSLERRKGLDYFMKEIFFLNNCITSKLLFLNSIPFFVLRTTIRLLPGFMGNLLVTFDNKRSKWNNDLKLKIYLKKL